MDQIVIALGATPAEQANWSEAWFRVAAHRDARRQPNTTTSASTGSVPRQLPSDVTAFTGRAEDLAELDGLLAGDAPTATAVVISAIAGTAGVGKTALAVHVPGMDVRAESDLWLPSRHHPRSTRSVSTPEHASRRYRMN
jgi:hypothetical protein